MRTWPLFFILIAACDFAQNTVAVFVNTNQATNQVWSYTRAIDATHLCRHLRHGRTRLGRRTRISAPGGASADATQPAPITPSHQQRNRQPDTEQQRQQRINPRHECLCKP